MLRRLGSGGTGVVYEVLDRERNDIVALKTLRSTDAASIYRLKKEFRTLVDVVHPNLVALYELIADGDHWFFTMELVDGSEFLTFVRPGALDVERLRFALAQIAQGIAAIHRAGKLHRDLKPLNVRVTPAGRVVILDFGISADVALKEPAAVTVEESIPGTVGYMAPEQAGGQATAASDWYALGCMLYEALTGRLPYTGSPLQVLVDKAAQDPERPDALVASLPPDLASLSLELLDRDPRRRPPGEEVLRRLGAPTSSSAVAEFADSTPGALLVGREAELADLERAFADVRQGQAVTVYVHGPSGIGKSALVHRFLNRSLRPGQAVVLSGRCHLRESMPYKGLDGVIDSLTRFLRSLPEPELERLVTPDVQTAVHLFPVLGRVDQVWEAPATEQHVQDPVQLRRRAFTALRGLLARISASKPIVIHIDDLQWSDADSMLLLEDLLGPPAPPAVLLLASFRDEDIAAHPFLATLLERACTKWVREIPVGPLSAAETAEQARHLLGRTAGEDSETVDAIVRESAGSPFLAEQLVRYVVMLRAEEQAGTAGISLGDMLQARIDQLPAGARTLLGTLAVAAGPVDAAVARDVAGLPGDERSLVALLQAERLLRSSSFGERLELYHDRIREALAAQIDPLRVPEIHLRLAASMEARGSGEPEALYEHYLEAGERDRAGSYAARAGDKASGALAFERAAAFYRQALALARESDRVVGVLRIKLGEALANAGRGAEAAKVYLAAADEATGGDGLELRRRAAEQLLRCGHVDQGLAVVRAVLRAVGLRLARSPRHALLRLLTRRAWIRVRGIGFVARHAEEVDPRVLSRIDACWSVAIGLARVDNIRAADFQTLHLRLALQAGEPYRVARALAAEAGFVSTGGGPSQARAAELVRAARAVAEGTERPEALAYAKFAAGIASFYIGRFAAARAECEAAERMMRERCTGMVWEINTAQTVVSSSLYYLGELAELARRVPLRLREARERGDLYAAADVTAGRPVVAWLLQDDVPGARQAIRDGMGPWSLQGFHVQHYFSLFAQGHVDLYAGEGLAAWSRTSERWHDVARSMVLRVQVIRLEALHLRARCALAAAMQQPHLASFLRGAARDARRVAREGMPWATPLADLVLAAIHAGRSETALAVQRTRRALAGFEAADMAGYAAAARRCCGRLIGGAEGAGLVAQADAWMKSQGVMNPERFTAMLAPGFPS
ncbi:MAG TPA: protein kinase [Gemmatimonadales bacterium]